MTDDVDKLPPGHYEVTLNSMRGAYRAEKREDGSWHLIDGTGWSDRLLDAECVTSAVAWSGRRAPC